MDSPKKTMKKYLCSLAVILFTMTVSAQNAERSGWSPEFSLKAFVSIYHGSYEVMAGARVGDNVFGIGSGLGLEHWDAYPADVRKIPVYGFYRRYVPLDRKRRFLLFGEATLGGECVYKIIGTDVDGGEIEHTPSWKWRSTILPGIALRLFKNSNIYLAPTAEILPSSHEVNGCLTAGLTVGF